MAAPKTVLTFPLDGSRKDFDIPFEYLARKFVVITLVGATRRILTANSDYRFATKRTVTTTKAWGPGDLFTNIEIRRVTSATERLVDFSDGSVLRAYDLNTAQVQSLHIAEEARDLTADTIAVNNDGDLDARGRKIVNVADGVLDGDAVSLGQNRRWAESALNQANRSEQQANASAESARLAGVHNYEAKDAASRSDSSAGQSAGARDIALNARDKAKAWSEANEGVQVEPNMYSSKAWAKTSQYHAGESQASANASEQSRANSQASNLSSIAAADRSNADAARAKTEADKLGNANQFMGTISKVVNNTPYWRDAGQFYGSLYLQRVGSPLSNEADAIRWTHLDDGRLILVDDPRARVRLVSDTAGNLYPQGNLESLGTHTAVSTVNVRAPNDQSNAHLWLRGPNNENRAIVYAGADKTLRMSVDTGAIAITLSLQGLTTVPGNIGLASASLQTDGNIVSSIYAGGTLHSHLSQLSNPTPRKLSIVPLWTGGAVGTGSLISLNDDAFNYSSFMSMYSGTTSYSSWSGMLELCALPLGTTMYLSVAPNGWIACKFEDANPAQRRQLRLVQFAANNGLTGFYGVRVNPPA